MIEYSIQNCQVIFIDDIPTIPKSQVMMWYCTDCCLHMSLTEIVHGIVGMPWAPGARLLFTQRVMTRAHCAAAVAAHDVCQVSNKNKTFPQQQVSVNKMANIGAGCSQKFEQRDDQLFARA